MGAFPEFLAALRPRLEATLESLLPSPTEEPATLHAAMRYSVLDGGKRIRPALTVLFGSAFGAPRERLLPGAAALELIHAFSLIHDDLPALDDDDLRRGRPSLHREFGEAAAILAGDALLNLGLTVLASQPSEVEPEARRAAVELVGTAIGTRGMIGGQMADLEAESAWPAEPEAALEAIHRRKTGALLTAACRLGGIYGGADAGQQDLLGRIGDRIGLMFQIGDDILDVEGTADRLGKAVGKDAEARKLTYPGLYGLEHSRRRLGEVRDEALALAAELPAADDLLASFIDFLHSRDR